MFNLILLFYLAWFEVTVQIDLYSRWASTCCEIKEREEEEKKRKNSSCICIKLKAWYHDGLDQYWNERLRKTNKRMLLKKRYFLFLRIKKKKKKKKIGLSLFPTKAALSHDSFSKQNNCHYEPFYPIISKSRHRFSANFFSWFPSVLCFGSIGKKRERERERERDRARGVSE